jgi:hypothetical protein
VQGKYQQLLRVPESIESVMAIHVHAAIQLSGPFLVFGGLGSFFVRPAEAFYCSGFAFFVLMLALEIGGRRMTLPKGMKLHNRVDRIKGTLLFLLVFVSLIAFYFVWVRPGIELFYAFAGLFVGGPLAISILVRMMREEIEQREPK